MSEQDLRKIKIGTSTIGLIGLDMALREVLARELPTEEAVDYLFDKISQLNYIPSSAHSTYREALERELGRLAAGQESSSEILDIKILGPGCVSCNKLNTMIFDIMARLGIAADIVQIHDHDEIWRHGVLATPALIINNQIKCAGKMPSPAEVEEFLTEASA